MGLASRRAWLLVFLLLSASQAAPFSRQRRKKPAGAKPLVKKPAAKRSQQKLPETEGVLVEQRDLGDAATDLAFQSEGIEEGHQPMTTPLMGPFAGRRRAAKPLTWEEHTRKKLISQGVCKRLMWFTSLSLPMARDFSSVYIQLLEVALMSAIANAPSLLPVLIYDGPPQPITTWWERMGGLVIYHELSFWGSMKEAEDSKMLPQGHAERLRAPYLRFDIPLLFNEALTHFGSAADPTYFLYTHADVLFLRDFTNCTMKTRPGYLMLGGEFTPGEIANAGVMYANIHTFQHEREAILKYAKSSSFKIEGDDQGLLLQWFKQRIELLPDQFNWKGYWGRPVLNEEPYIVHWHGPKPGHCLPCFLAYPTHYEAMCKEPYCPSVLIHTFKQNSHRPTVAKYYKELVHQYEVLLEAVRRTQVPGYHF